MCVLTIAVPIFNMEWCLDNNLSTYHDPRLAGKVEVLCLNNASEDHSLEIIEKYTSDAPEIFKLLNRDNRGYGSSINEALAVASGRYFRIIDADDWVDTEELIRQTEELDHCVADVVLTDYEVVSMKTGRHTPVTADGYGVTYNVVKDSFDWPEQTLPSIHATTYRTELLRGNGFFMQDKMFFVDEEYVIIPYLHAKTVLYLPLNIYRYQVANPEQSTSPGNRAKYQDHRRRVLCRLIDMLRAERQKEAGNKALSYCEKRISQGIGDHFTTLLIYVRDRTEGRRLAKEWEAYIRREVPELWEYVKRKAAILYSLNALHVSLPAYLRLKKLLLKK